MPVDTELQKAIDSAAKEITKDLPEGHKAKELVTAATETQVEEAEEQQVEEVESADEPQLDTDGLTEDQIKEARKLYRALSNPETAPAIAAALATRFGVALGQQPLETKKETVAAKKDILSIFKEELGESYAFLAPNLAKAVDKALEGVREEQRATQLEIQVQQLEKDVTSALGTLAKETNGASRKLETRMSELMDKYPYSDKAGTIEQYIRDIHQMAGAPRAKAAVQQATADKIRRNANNVADRITRTSSVPSLDALPNGKKLGIKGAVQWAADQLAKGK